MNFGADLRRDAFLLLSPFLSSPLLIFPSQADTLYRMHRFRTTSTPIKGLTSDILVSSIPSLSLSLRLSPLPSGSTHPLISSLPSSFILSPPQRSHLPSESPSHTISSTRSKPPPSPSLILRSVSLASLPVKTAPPGTSPSTSV